MSEQTIVEGGKRRLRTKEDGGMSSDMLQSPADPEATFHEKAGEQHHGYVGNIEESIGKTDLSSQGTAMRRKVPGDGAMLRNHLEKNMGTETRDPYGGRWYIRR